MGGEGRLTGALACFLSPTTTLCLQKWFCLKFIRANGYLETSAWSGESLPHGGKQQSRRPTSAGSLNLFLPFCSGVGQTEKKRESGIKQTGIH